MRNRDWRNMAAALLLALAFAGQASACPLCKEAVANQDDLAKQDGKPTTFMKHGYNWSVLFMMGMPFVLLGTGALMVARAVKRGEMPEW
jgi:hypothetical protein